MTKQEAIERTHKVLREPVVIEHLKEAVIEKIKERSDKGFSFLKLDFLPESTAPQQVALEKWLKSLGYDSNHAFPISIYWYVTKE